MPLIFAGDGARVNASTGTDLGAITGKHQTLYVPTPYPYRRHALNNSLGTLPTFPTTGPGEPAAEDEKIIDDNQPVALTHSFVYEGPQRARTITYPGTSHRPTRSLCTKPTQLKLNQDKPLPCPPPESLILEDEPAPEPIEKEEESGREVMSVGVCELNEDTLRGNRRTEIEKVIQDQDERVDKSFGSWLDSEGAFDPATRDSVLVVADVNGRSFDLDDYLPRALPPPSPSPQPSITTERPPRQPRATTPSSPPSVARKASDHLRDQLEFFGNPNPASSPPSRTSMASFKPMPIHTDTSSLAKSVFNRPGSEGDGLFELSPPHFARQPKVDPSNFPDPYPQGMSYHHPPSTTPALSSAGSSSASTRSSAYTNPGSTISASGFSGDYSHVRVASGDDFDGVVGVSGGIVGARTSTGSSLSSGSRKSHGFIHAPQVPLPRMRHADYTRSSRSPSQSQPEDFAAPPVAYERTDHPLRSQPSYDMSWQREHDDFGTSEEEYDYEHPEDDEDEEKEEMLEPEPTSAVSVAEEGRGLIVHGEGMPVHALSIQPGITHLLVGGSSTPNSVPAFLTTMIPQISSTLLALDISANFLVSLSPVLASCACLEELNISANPLRVVPEFLALLPTLRVLLADSTGISTIPPSLAALEKLHTLGIRRNKLHALPSWLCTLPCLESLLVDGNPFQGPWRALVEPLLAKVPMTPAYPPSTPMISQFSATYSTTSNTTTADTTDLSDAEDYTDQDEPNAVLTGPPVHTHSPSAGPASGDANEEDDTITPAHARLLERAATSPSAHHTSASLSRPLSRTRTTPNRNYYERERQSRTEQSGGVSPLASPPLGDTDRIKELNASYAKVTALESSNLMSPTISRDLRRMRSADELRSALQPGQYSGGAQAGSSLLSPPSSPPRPGLTHYATSISAVSTVSENVEGLSQQRRFGSLNMHSRSPSRPVAATLFGELPNEEGADADIDSPPRTISRARAATSISISRAARDEEYERSIRQSLAKPKNKDKERSSRKWGFLKKMSMGKLRTVDGSPSYSVPSSRPSSSSGTAGSSMSRPTIPTFASASATPRQLSPPQVEVALQPSDSINAAPVNIGSPPPAIATPTILQNESMDKLKITSPSTPATPSFSNMLAPPPPPSPMSKASKRRSFLPIDGPPSLNIPIPSTSPFLGGLTATNGSEDQDDASRIQSPSPIIESPMELHNREEERNREANARALRSVMAYLKDMNDLTLLSQGSVLSMYGNGSAPLMDRSRRPTLIDAQRMNSENSFDSGDSISSAPTTASSHLRSLDSLSGNRSGSLNTMSVATTDSSGSGEERKCKDDRGKRLMIVREIVETERTYVKNLQDLVDIYVRPAAVPVNSIGNVTSSSKETVVPAAERKIVFGGLEALYTFHKESFFPALEAAARPLLTPQGAASDADSDGKLSSEVAMSVGRIFVSHAAFMKMYSSYINNFENSVSRIRQWVSAPGPGSSTLTPSSSTAHLANVALTMSAMAPNSPSIDSASAKAVLSSSQRKRIKHYLKRCRLNPKHSQLNLEGYLLLPVQRIPRYRLLLEDLTRSTPPPDTFDDPLDRALTEISSLATNMNEGKREAESRRKLVMWQARIRGKFPSPLVQPHRRLIMDGKLLLTRIVRKQTMAFEVLDSHGDASSVAVDCLAPELTPRPLYGVLCNDLFVLCRDPSNGQDPNAAVDLWAVLRMQTMPQPTSIVHGNTLRIVDTKAILYLEAPSTSEALTWFRAINMHVPSPMLEA